jgi:hypothetical protein
VGFLTSHNPIGLHGQLWDSFTFYLLTRKEAGLKVNADKTICCCVVTRIQNRDIKVANRSFESVAELNYLGRTVTNQRLIRGLFIEHVDMFKTGQNATKTQRSHTFGLSVGLLSPSAARSHSMGNRDKHKLLSHRNIRARPTV